MRIGKVTYKNYGPFESAEVDFSKDGLTTIEGIVKNDPYASGNGAGKSLLIGGFVWCAYGRNLTPDFEGDNVIRNGAKSCNVTTEIVGAEKSITIRRYRSDPDFKNQVRIWIDGKDESRGTNDATQAFIDSLLMDFTGFSSSVCFGAREDVKEFFSAPDSQRKKLLEVLLGLEEFSGAEEYAAGQVYQFANDMSQATALNLQAQVNGAQSALEQITDTDSSEEKELLTKKISELAEQHKTKTRQLQGDSHKLSFMKTEWQQKRDAYETEYVKANQGMEEAQKKIDCATEDIGKEKSRLQIKTKDLAATKALKGKCPTCKQVVGAAHLKTAGKELEKEIEDAKWKIEAGSVELLQHRRELDAIKIPSEPDESEIATLENKISNGKTELNSTAARHKDAKERLASIDKAEATKAERRRRMEADIAAKQAEIAKLNESSQAAKEECELWGDVREAMSNRGIKSFLLESEIGQISREATQLASRLVGPGALIELGSVTTLKGGGEREKISVRCELPKQYAKRYPSASRGQKKKLDLSLVLALRDANRRRQAVAFDQFFADELFDGLDPVGCERAVELLLEMSSQYPVILVTHADRLKQIGSRQIKVTHDGNTATVKNS